MSDAKICDTCGKIIIDKAQLFYEEKSDDGNITIKLTDKDWCERCAIKTYAKMSMNAWEDNKSKKKKKVANKQESQQLDLFLKK